MLAVLAAAAASLFLLETRPAPQSKPLTERVFDVDALSLKRQDVSPHISLTGRLEPVRTTDLRFEVNGQVLERLVELGHAVETSQTLFVVDDRDYRDALTQAQAEFDIIKLDIERDRALLKLAKRKTVLQAAEVKRFAGLDQQMLSSRSQLDAAEQKLLQLRTEQVQLENAIAASQSRLQISRSRLNLARRNLARTRLLSPYDGAVNALHAEEGDYVNLGQMALELVDVSAFDFLVNVRGDLASVLHVGDAVTLTIQRKEYRAKLRSVQRVPDAGTYSHEVFIRVAAPDLYAAMTGTVDLPLPPQRDVFVVPLTALQYVDGRSYLFVIDDDRLLHRVEVKTGARLRKRVIVRGALRDGQNFVAHSVESLSGGETVFMRSASSPTS